ncbi:uncharacterized protein LOC116266186 isoform X3 [Nymphaea colorata]|uniref:uncharacterized protein LOC116266186 isoform X3 n=1 Tax=Nymphaea colorata TaxID=210225 RepID=UPI00129D969E|nr:uncharacterized protein LOC116266186 isoform X3 [Nymphaea colorata]
MRSEKEKPIDRALSFDRFTDLLHDISGTQNISGLLQTDSNSILHAAMSLFDAIPSGRILSRGRERKGSQNEVSEFGKSETALSMVVGFLLVMSTNGASAFLYPVVDDENDGVTQI